MSTAAVLLLLALGCRGDGSTSTGPEARDATTLAVVTATSGDGLDSDGYTVTVDGGSGRSVGINDTTAYADLTAEDHTVELSGVASHCSVSGSNPRTVTVTDNDTTPTSFDVNCESSSASSTPVYSDGFESGDGSHSGNGFSWTYIGGGGCNAITTDNPRNGSYSVQVHFDAGDQENCLVQLATPPVGFDTNGNVVSNGREIWVEYYQHVPANYYHPSVDNHNNKFFQIWSGSRTGTEGWKYVHETQSGDERPGGWNGESGESYSKVYWDADDPGTRWSYTRADPATIDLDDRGNWVRWRYYAKISTPHSDAVDNDGVIKIWKDDKLIIEDTSAKTADYLPDDNSIDAIRWWGAQNSGYNEDTVFHIDDIRIYLEDPGW